MHSGIIDSLISAMKSRSCIIQEKYCIIEQRMTGAKLIQDILKRSIAEMDYYNIYN